jgi:hypothetical protein
MPPRKHSAKRRKRVPARARGASKNHAPGSLLKKVRKPLAPPARIEEDAKKYKRARERERQRRTESNSGENPDEQI